MTKTVFLDTETTGRDPNIHHVWDIAIITGNGEEHQWMVRPDLTHADPNALKIGRYWERFRISPFRHPESHIAAEVARLLADAVVIGSNPSFDQAFLTPWLREHGQVWAAHYRTVDVTTLGAGFMYATAALPATPGDPHALPFSTTQIRDRFGIDPADYDLHTALGDCRWTRDLFQAITGKATTDA